MGGFDEDADYDYYDNGVPPGGVPDAIAPPPPPPPPAPLTPLPKKRVVQPPVQRNPYNNQGNYGGGPPRQGLVGKEACKSGIKSVAHETACDLFYECYGDQGFLQSCPNGLVYVNDGRFGLVGNCDYPHNENCLNRPERSK